MHRSPIDLGLLAGLAMLTGTAATAPAEAAQSEIAATTASAPRPSAADDDEESAEAAVSRCERRARGRLRAWDRFTDATVSATRRVGRFLGASDASVARVLRWGHSLSEEVMERLDCTEQHQAEVATARAIAGGVGTTSRWTSETRQNVRGSSTVVALDGSGGCMTVTDIIIVDGEEISAPKRMCRRPPSNRYVRV